jgi:hypothetical protein
MNFPLQRFEAVSRRQFLRTVALGTAVLLPACADDGSGTLGTALVGDTGDPASTSPAGTVSPTASPATSPATSPTGSATGGALPDGAELQVGFTYSAGGIRIKNPYIAVWVETPEGELVNTVSLWLKRDKSRYLDHLKQWYDAEAELLDAGGPNNLDAIAGATRAAGAYQVVWDCHDVYGERVVAGDYVLCVESAREHGSRSFVSGPLTLAGEAFTVALADDGELSAVAVTYVV